MSARGCLIGFVLAFTGAGMAQAPALLSAEATVSNVASGAKIEAAFTTTAAVASGERADSAGAATRQVGPACPGWISRNAHLGGVVVMRALVGKDGAIESLSVVSGPEQLRDSATKAVAQWRYTPYLVDGQAIEVFKTIEVDYELGR